MSDVFVSYSRKNIEFAKKLVGALKAKGREVWIDLDEIPPSAEWWAEIKRGIDGADMFVPILTPESLSSPVCMFEMDYALKNNKRIVPVMRQQSDIDLAFVTMAKLKPTGFLAEILGDADMLSIARGNWRSVEPLNWIFAQDADDLNAAVDRLIYALDADLDRVRLHTRLLVRAREWELRQRDPSYLLVGTDLRDAASWLTVYGDQEPRATDEHRVHIQASLDAEATQRAKDEATARRVSNLQRVRVGLLIAALIAGLIAVFSAVQTNSAVQREGQANTRVADAGTQAAATLSPIPVTLTYAGDQLSTATVAQGEASYGEATANFRANERSTQAADIGARVSYLLAQNANSILRLEGGNSETGVLLGIRAMNTAYTHEADMVLLKSLDRLFTRRIFLGHTGDVTSVAFSPDGLTILSGSSDNTVRLWSVVTGENVRIAYGHSDSVQSVSFSPDGQTFLSSSSDQTVRLWDVNTGEPIRIFGGHTAAVNSAAYSPDGQTILSGDSAGIMRLWNINTGETLRILRSYSGGIESVAYSPDGRRAVSGGMSGLDMWNLDGGQLLWHTSETLLLQSVDFSFDGNTLVSGSWMLPGVQIWDSLTGEKLQDVPGTGITFDVNYTVTNGGSLVSGGSAGEVQSFDLALDRLRIDRGHLSEVLSVTGSPDGYYILSGSKDGTIRLWDIYIGAQSRAFFGHRGERITSVAYSPDGQRVISSGFDGDPKVWDVASNRITSIGADHINTVLSLAYSPKENTALSGTFDDELVLWDTTTGRTLRIFRGHENDVTTVAFSPDGITALSGSSDQTIRLWEVATGEELNVFRGHEGQVNSIAFSPDGTTALSGSSDQTIRLWEVATGEELNVFREHGAQVNTVAFSPDGRIAASGSDDSTARLWDIEQQKQVRVIDGEWGHITTVVFSPNGRKIFLGTSDGRLRLLDVDPQDLIAYACTRVFRDFTPTEREEYGLDDSPTCPQFGGWADDISTPMRVNRPIIPVWTPIASPTRMANPTQTPTH